MHKLALGTSLTRKSPPLSFGRRKGVSMKLQSHSPGYLQALRLLLSSIYKCPFLLWVSLDFTPRGPADSQRGCGISKALLGIHWDVKGTSPWSFPRGWGPRHSLLQTKSKRSGGSGSETPGVAEGSTRPPGVTHKKADLETSVPPPARAGSRHRTNRKALQVRL